jgi:hypothetical protein
LNKKHERCIYSFVAKFSIKRHRVDDCLRMPPYDQGADIDIYIVVKKCENISIRK